MAFNREHVLLEALGQFRQEHGEHVVIRCVCRECNGNFGRTIDCIFARGSLEALLRIELGLKPVEEVTDLLKDRLEFRFPLGSYTGLWLEPIPDGGRIVLRPMSQAGFTMREGDGWLYITVRELKQFTRLPDAVDSTGLKRALAPTQEGYDEVLAEFQRLRVSFTPEGPLPIPERWGEVEAEVTAEVDIATRRCVAKMAFNYLAWVMGSEFVLRPDFNPIRQFIRDGSIQPHRVVTESQKQILADDQALRRQTRDHLIVVQWDDRTSDLVSLFSPFNEITYRIVLTGEFSGVWRPIPIGHYFDLETHRVLALFPSSLLPAR